MKKMTPREALYYICLELGPTAQTNRDDNITDKEARLRDAIRTLQNFVTYHDTGFDIPDSAEEYQHKDWGLPDSNGEFPHLTLDDYVDELPPYGLSREDFIE